jgi:sugar lactone lactonase YvrE
MRKTQAGVAMGLVTALGMALPVAAQGPAIEEVVSGLNSPRGVALGPDGTIYVAESGVGGEGPCVQHSELGNMCFGHSGKVTAIVDGVASKLVVDLPSGITDLGEVIGPSDVTVDADGTVWFLVGGPAAGAAEFREAMPDGAGEGIGWLYRLTDGGAEAVADLAAFETASNPDVDQPGNTEPDSNAHGLAAAPAGALVADAGGNDLLLVGADGTISSLAVFPVVMQPAPPDPSASPDPSAEPPMIPMDPVPTSVTVGPDGAYYVGQLTGFPFPAGGASVFRVADGEEPSVYATGFSAIMDLEFGPDGTLYVLEMAHDGLLAALGALETAGPANGGLLAVPAGGGEPTLIASEGLLMPGGLAVAEDGSIYVSTCTICPEVGGVVKVTP